MHPTWSISYFTLLLLLPVTFAAHIAASTPELSPQYTDDLTFRTSMLNSTNFFRYLYSAPFVYWNRTLASQSQSYSSECNWVHSGAKGYGENLADGYANVTAVVDGWGNERKNYKFSDSNPTGFSDKTGHFTQLVWQSTITVGCGWTDCGDKNNMLGVFVVCQYYPAGNVNGNDKEFFKQNVLREREDGAEGFEDVEVQATLGADGTVPTVTGGAGASPTGESAAPDWMKADGGVVAVVVLLVAAVVGFVLFF